MSGTRRRQRGFTFIETILTLVVIGTGLFGLTYLYSNLSFQFYQADLQVMATDLAQQKLEQVLAIKAGSGYNAVGSAPNENIVTGAYTFTRSTAVDYVVLNNDNTITVSAVDTGYKRITVQVTWNGNPGTGVTIMSLVTNQIPLL